MAYPNEIDKFTEKLNKLEGNTYVIEEKIELVNGTYEGDLQHDNISLPSFAIYTGSKLTGQKVENYILSTPSNAPWEKHIKIFSNVSPVYISYETQGDTVEADDINKVQESIVNTQKEVERYKAFNDTKVSNVENSKVDKVKGKQLSTEDYTTEEKNKVAKIPENFIASVNGETADKTGNIEVTLKGPFTWNQLKGV